MNNIDSEVIVGKNGYLYLGKGGHNIIDYITGSKKIDKQSFINFEDNIKHRSDFCLKNNIKYKHFIYPCKHSIMKHNFPIKEYTSLIDFYKPYFTKDVVDMRDVLNGQTIPVYLKKDTHLNFNGLKISVKYTFEKLLKKYKNYDDIFDACKNISQETAGDLGSKIIPIESEKRATIKTVWNLKRFNNRSGKGNDGLIHIVFNVNKLNRFEFNRCVIFGDSFSYLNLPLLSYEFSEILFMRTRYFHEEIVSMFKPDVVISQNVERYFSYVDSDNNAPRFNLLYGLKGTQYVEDSSFYEAYNAILNYGKKPYWDLISKITNSNLNKGN